MAETVTNTITLPDGAVARKGTARLQLIASADVDHAPGWYATDNVTVLGTTLVTVDSTGTWTADLVANDDPNLDPTGTVYRVTETVPTHHNPVVYYIDVTLSPGGPYWVGDILATAPATIAGAATLEVPEDTVVGRLTGDNTITAITLADLKAALDALP